MPLKAQLVLPTIDTCTWREASSSGVSCRLISELVGESSARVTDEICVACCRSFPPSPKLFNPPTASLLLRATTQILELGGNHECTAERAAELQRVAESSINVVHSAIDSSVPARNALQCCWLGNAAEEPVTSDESSPSYTCHHIAHQRTTVDACRACHDWALRRPKSRLLNLDEIIPLPIERCGTVRKWSVAVTTSPRRDTTLEATLDSLVRAGWPELHLFVDGTVQLPTRYAHLPITWREDGLGAWPAWYFALAESVLKRPDADAYMMLQDDVVLFDRECLRAYLERALWPGKKPGIVSLFFSASDRRAGWFDAHRRWHFSAQGLVLGPGVARALLADSDVMRSVLAAAGGTHIPVPEVISQWAFAHDVSVWYANPSLAQHIGNTSTIWMNANITAGRRAAWFSGSVDAEFGQSDTLADFPEQAFTVRGTPTLRATYDNQVAKGTIHMRQSNVVICGVVRDERLLLPRTAARIERLGEMFADYRVILVHQGGQCAINEFLSDWSRANPKLEVITDDVRSEACNNSLKSQRAADRARCRNRYRTRIVERHRTSDYVVVVDMGLAGGWSFDGVAHTFGAVDWDAVGSYGLASNWASADKSTPYVHSDSALRLCHNDGAAERSRLDAVDRLRGMPLMPVESCFGGLAVYRTVCMQHGEYCGDTCEHVGFHKRLCKAGYSRLFLNPNQIAIYDPI